MMDKGSIPYVDSQIDPAKPTRGGSGKQVEWNNSFAKYPDVPFMAVY